MVLDVVTDVERDVVKRAVIRARLGNQDFAVGNRHTLDCVTSRQVLFLVFLREHYVMLTDEVASDCKPNVIRMK